MMSIKTVNALSHYTDWTIGHVHSGALGWVGFITIGALYCLVPRLFGRTQMYSVQARSTLHFWIATIGIVLYIAAMWIAGVMQGLMWRAVNADGTLTYTLRRERQGDVSVLRASALLGGVLFLAGMLIMAYNIWMTRRPAARPSIASVASRSGACRARRSPHAGQRMSTHHEPPRPELSHEKIETQRSFC